MGIIANIAALSAATAAAVALTPLSVAFARRWGVLDLPGVRKVHASPTPRLGGLAIALATCLVSIIVLAAGDFELGWGSDALRQVLVLLVTGLFVLGVGVVDDLVTVRSKFKLLTLLTAALAVCASGVRIDAILLNGQPALELGWAAWPITMLWIVGVTISINFIDGLDGLAGGIAAIACAVIAVTASLSGHGAATVLSLALLGSLIGFLFFNFNPARVFMGDGGSMFVGFALGTLTVFQHPAAGSTAGLMLPALALAVPLADTFLTVVRRGVIHRSFFVAERDHIHHKLLEAGLCQRHAVYILYGVSLVSAGVGLIALLDRGWATAAGLVILLPLLVGLFRTAGSTRIRETIAAIRRNRAIGRQTRRYQRVFDELLPRFREARTFSTWWDTVCAAADELDFVIVNLPTVRRDGSRTVMRWSRDDGKHLESECMSVIVPIPQRRHQAPLNVSVEVAAIGGNLEIAGLRVALFSRLVGEHSVARLPDGTNRVKSLGPKQSSNGEPAAAETNDPADSTAGDEPAATPGPTPDRVREFDEYPTDGNGSQAKADVHVRQTPVPRAADVLDLLKTALLRGAPAVVSAPDRQRPRVAVVHDFLYCYAGAERVLEQILNVYPDAELFALFDFLPKDQRGFIRNKRVRTTFIQRLPLASRKHRLYLPLMPVAIEQLDVSAYDIVISSSYLAAKGVLTRPDQLHVCYCHTPVRFAWDQQNQYLGTHGLVSGLKSMLARLILHYIRNWDVRSAGGVDVFLTNSDFVGRRIQKIYRRPSTTVHPPVATDRFCVGDRKEDFYLTASRLVPYKRVDLIVAAFKQMPHRRLIVVGDGPDFEKIKAAAGPNVRFVGHQPFEKLRQYLQLARAFVFAAEEDFGIAPVEAQACGTPVIAFGRGGVTESVVEGQTGIFFSSQTPEAIVEAVERFERHKEWNPAVIRANAERFSSHQFRQRFSEITQRCWSEYFTTPWEDRDRCREIRPRPSGASAPTPIPEAELVATAGANGSEH